MAEKNYGTIGIGISIIAMEFILINHTYLIYFLGIISIIYGIQAIIKKNNLITSVGAILLGIITLILNYSFPN